jgi:nucleotide-binding universal stress UspA family protein
MEGLMIFRKILIALDVGPIAAHAVDVGIELGRSLKADMALIHVMGLPVPVGGDIGVPPEEITTLVTQEGRRLLDGVRQRLSLEASVLEFLESGDPTVEIVKAAKAWPADLIVIGSHGRGGLDRMMLGSVAEAVMRRAPCPVLVIRPGE